MSQQSMKGLKNFIVDIRACKSTELERQRINKELANIRKQFKSAGDSKHKIGDKQLDGYQKKKYICKLVYMYLLGYDIDFGHVEAINLISSKVYSEKQMGYLFVSVLLNENSEMLRLLVQSIKNDLSVRNETHVCLGLTCIANLGGRDMAETLATTVQQLLVSKDSSSFVKKKAALCLLRLYRKHPDVIPAGEWATQIVNLLDEKDIGVVTAVLSLLLSIVAEYSAEYAKCIPKAIYILKKITASKNAKSEQNLWVQVKILRLIQSYEPPKSSSDRDDLVHCLKKKIIVTAEDRSANNGRNAVLSEAMKTIIHLENEAELIFESTDILGRFLKTKDTNTRYIALDIMCEMCNLPYALDVILKHLKTVTQALRYERDISVRRRALDLMFRMCNTENSKTIINALITFLEHAEYAIREEMVLKIALLAEKFCLDYSFYVDVILNLIRLAGDYVGDEVWFRVIQIVTNREDVQDYATRECFEALCTPACHETMVRVGGYILGEYGHLIAHEPRSSPEAQFEVLHHKFYSCSNATRAMLLSTYIKFVNLFPDLKTQVIEILKQGNISKNTDAELQQRAVEYINLGVNASDDLLQAVFEEMPMYPERESSILAKLKAKDNFVTDKTWASSKKGRNAATNRELNDIGDVNSGSNENTSVGQSQYSQSSGVASMPGQPTLGDSPGPITEGTEKWLIQAVSSDTGIIFEDSVLQLGIKVENKGNLGRMAIYHMNKTTSPFICCSEKIHTNLVTGKIDISCSKPMADMMNPNEQVISVVQYECFDVFDNYPIFEFLFQSQGQFKKITLKLPLFISNFGATIEMNKDNFVQRWNNLGGPGMEVIEIFTPKVPIETGVSENILARKLKGMNFALMQGFDPNPNNVVGACVISTQKSQIGVLFRMEPSVQAQQYRLTMRTSKPEASKRLVELIKTQA